MKKKNLILYISLFLGILINGCKEDATFREYDWFELETNLIEVHKEGFSIKGEITKEGSYPITEKGFIVSREYTNPFYYPSVTQLYDVSYPATEDFTYTVNNDLDENGQVYVRSYIKTGNMNYLGNLITVQTSGSKEPEIHSINLVKYGDKYPVLHLEGKYFSSVPYRMEIKLNTYDYKILEANETELWISSMFDNQMYLKEGTNEFILKIGEKSTTILYDYSTEPIFITSVSPSKLTLGDIFEITFEEKENADLYNITAVSLGNSPVFHSAQILSQNKNVLRCMVRTNYWHNTMIDPVIRIEYNWNGIYTESPPYLIEPYQPWKFTGVEYYETNDPIFSSFISVDNKGYYLYGDNLCSFDMETYQNSSYPLPEKMRCQYPYIYEYNDFIFVGFTNMEFEHQLYKFDPLTAKWEKIETNFPIEDASLMSVRYKEEVLFYYINGNRSEFIRYTPGSNEWSRQPMNEINCRNIAIWRNDIYYVEDNMIKKAKAEEPDNSEFIFSLEEYSEDFFYHTYVYVYNDNLYITCDGFILEFDLVNHTLRSAGKPALNNFYYSKFLLFSYEGTLYGGLNGKMYKYQSKD